MSSKDKVVLKSLSLFRTALYFRCVATVQSLLRLSSSMKASQASWNLFADVCPASGVAPAILALKSSLTRAMVGDIVIIIRLPPQRPLLNIFRGGFLFFSAPKIAPNNQLLHPSFYMNSYGFKRLDSTLKCNALRSLWDPLPQIEP